MYVTQLVASDVELDAPTTNQLLYIVLICSVPKNYSKGNVHTK